MALRRVAREILSAGSSAEAGARLRGGAVLEHRAQRQLLLAAAAVELRALVRSGPSGLPVRREGLTLHHALASARRRRDGARKLFRVRAFRARRQARPD